ncbi:MAG: RluA family pseudouridine synthase [Planctomycetota bacterium]|nr:RluA family pseudouridine synthase [Planctomycetota bacterium]
MNAPSEPDEGTEAPLDPTPIADSDPDSSAAANGLFDAGGKVDRDAINRLHEEREDDDAPVSVRFELSRDLKKRLDRYLVDRIPFMSRTALQRLIDEESVTVNGRRPKASTRLRLGDVVEAVLPPPPSNHIPPEPIHLDVLYEDADLIIINKHADIIVHPARAMKSGTIVNALSWRFQNQSSGSLSTVGEEFARPGIVHRLDRFTTGAMVAAKSDTAHWRLGHQFQNRTVGKRYLAVVHGTMKTMTDLVDLPIGRHPRIFDRYAVRFDDFGKSAQTIYRVREIFDGYTLVELELLTGRTHQIRVHLAYLGHPIAGDDYYGGSKLTRGMVIAKGEDDPDRRPDEPLLARQALHAALLEFDHPIDGDRRSFTAPLWPDMKELISLLRKHRHRRVANVRGCRVEFEPTDDLEA